MPPLSLLENATFDIVDYFRNGFNLGGRGTEGGDITAVSFNATAGKGFIQRYSSTSADNFNVTVIGGSFRNLNDSMIDANSFNVIAGTYFANESVARINVDNFNVTLSALIVEELVFVKSSTAVTLKLSALIIAPSMLLKILMQH